MYYRLTTYEFNPKQLDDMIIYADGIKDQAQNIEGLNFAHVCKTSETSGVLVAQYDNKEAMENGEKYLWKLIGGLPQFFTSPPNPVGSEVIWQSDH